MPRSARIAADPGWLPEVATSRMSSWRDLEPAEDPAGQACDDVDDVAFMDGLGDVGPAEGDPVQHVPVAPQRQLAVAAGRRPDAGDGQARTATSGSGLPGPHGASPANSRNRA